MWISALLVLLAVSCGVADETEYTIFGVAEHFEPVEEGEEFGDFDFEENDPEDGVEENSMQNNLEECTKHVDIEKLQNILSLPEADELDHVCPAILGFFDCVEGVVEDATGMTLKELVTFMQDSNMERFFNVYFNTRSVFVDLCNENSVLHRSYKDSSPCYKSIPTDDNIERCAREANTAYETYKLFEKKVEDESDEEDDTIQNRVCMMEAYKVACTGAVIHETCGQQAFDTFMTVVRRTTFFRNALCTEDQLKTLKTKFYDSLEMGSERKDLFRLALDLKRRRK